MRGIEPTERFHFSGYLGPASEEGPFRTRFSESVPSRVPGRHILSLSSRARIFPDDVGEFGMTVGERHLRLNLSLQPFPRLHIAVLSIVTSTATLLYAERRNYRQIRASAVIRKTQILHFYTTNLTRLSENLSSNSSRHTSLSRSSAAPICNS